MIYEARSVVDPDAVGLCRRSFWNSTSHFIWSRRRVWNNSSSFFCSRRSLKSG